MAYHTTKQCFACGKEFHVTSKNLDQKTCCKKCGWIYRRSLSPRAAIFQPETNTYLIPLTKGKYAEVDACDVDLADVFWQFHGQASHPYATRQTIDNGKVNVLMMHRIILERILGRPLTSGEVVDHVDGKGLRNVRSNIRLATVSQNAANAKTPSVNTSGKKGVTRSHGGTKWRAGIKVNGRNKHLGVYATVDEAHEAYMQAALKYHGSFANDGIREDVDNDES